MSNSGTKPQGATSYKETAFGVIPRAKLLQLEIEVEREADRKSYLTAMQKADEGDYSLLEQLIGSALSESLQSS